MTSKNESLRFVPKLSMGISSFRCMRIDELRQITEPFMVGTSQEILAVVVPYDLYMEMQKLIFDFESDPTRRSR